MVNRKQALAWQRWTRTTVLPTPDVEREYVYLDPRVDRYPEYCVVTFYRPFERDWTIGDFTLTPPVTTEGKS